MEFWTYYRMLRRRRWLLAASMLVALAVGLVVIRSRGDDYEASATLSIPSEQRALFLLGAPDQGSPDVRMALALNLLRSRDLVDRVIQRLGPGLRPDDLPRRLRVERDRGSGLIRVTVTGKTPDEAVTLVNTVAETAAAYDQEVQSRESRLAREFVEKQVDAARENVRKAEEALLRFEQEHAFVLATAKSDQVAALETEGQRLALSLNEIEARLSLIHAQMNQQSATRSDQEITDNPIARQLRGDLVQLEVALTSELAIHTERYPTVAALKAKIDAIKDRLSRELGKTVSAERVQHNPIYDALTQDRIKMETEKVALQAKREALLRALDRIQQDLPGLAQIKMEQSRLTRNVDNLNKEYADLKTRLYQLRLKEQETQDLGSLAVVGHAHAGRPASPQGKVVQVLLACVLGLLGGGGLIYFLDYVDNTLKTTENAERLLGVPTLVAIPRHNPPFEEAYRLLQVVLADRRAGEQGPPRIAVTSPRPGAGTSTVVVNLARAFARSGWRTLVIDGAFQRPTQHVFLGVANAKGLGGVLTGEATIDDALVQTTVPNLWLLPSGADPERIIGLLGSARMAGLLDDLGRRMDVILIDTPPVGAFADVLTMAPLVTGVLLVLDANQVPRGVEERVKAQFTRFGVKVLGSVVTKVRPDLVDSYVYREQYHHHPPRRGWSPRAAAAAALGLAMVVGSFIAGTQISLPEGPRHGLADMMHTVAHVMSTFSRP